MCLLPDKPKPLYPGFLAYSSSHQRIVVNWDGGLGNLPQRAACSIQGWQRDPHCGQPCGLTITSCPKCPARPSSDDSPLELRLLRLTMESFRSGFQGAMPSGSPG